MTGNLREEALDSAKNDEPPEDALRFIDAIVGDREASVRVRLLPKRRNAPQARELVGSLRELDPEIRKANAAGCDAYVVANEVRADLGIGPSARDDDVTEVRAVFIDCDGTKRPPDLWHGQNHPHVIMIREDDPLRWWAVWRIEDLPVDRFKEVQRCLAEHYETDENITNPSRVVRLPGYLRNPKVNRKTNEPDAEPTTYRLELWDPISDPYPIDDFLEGLPPCTDGETTPNIDPARAVEGESAGKPVTEPCSARCCHTSTPPSETTRKPGSESVVPSVRRHWSKKTARPTMT